jgi:hypothetical protein
VAPSPLCDEEAVVEGRLMNIDDVIELANLKAAWTYELNGIQVRVEQHEFLRMEKGVQLTDSGKGFTREFAALIFSEVEDVEARKREAAKWLQSMNKKLKEPNPPSYKDEWQLRLERSSVGVVRGAEPWQNEHAARFALACEAGAPQHAMVEAAAQPKLDGPKDCMDQCKPGGDEDDEVEEVDDDGPEVEELDDVLLLEDGAHYGVSTAGLGLHIDGIEDDDYGVGGGGRGAIAGFSGDAVAAAAAAAAAVHPDDGAPRALKRWLLPPSLTPKRGRRSGGPPEMVPVDADARPSADGAWRCRICGAAYEARIGLFAHARFCEGRAVAWACEWCNCSEEETNHRATGPNGIKTLCSACNQRWRHGADGMPEQNDKGEFLCATCGRGFPTMNALGPHRRFCDGGAWRCAWCECNAEETTGKGPGPDGGKMLCSTCSARWRSGHTGPPPTDTDGRYPCERCERSFETFRALGVHSRDCDGGAWRCKWCECQAHETSGKNPGVNACGWPLRITDCLSECV